MVKVVNCQNHRGGNTEPYELRCGLMMVVMTVGVPQWPGAYDHPITTSLLLTAPVMQIALHLLFLTYLPWPSAGAIWTRSIKGNPGGDEVRDVARPENESKSRDYLLHLSRALSNSNASISRRVRQCCKENSRRSSQTMVSSGSSALLTRGGVSVMRSAALSQRVNKPDCFRRATARMQQRCADLDDVEEEKISCKVYLRISRIQPGLSRLPVAISMTLCELEIAHLSLPMECRSAEKKATTTPMERRYCVEWVLFLSTYSHAVLMTSNSGRWLEVPSRGLVTLGTSENQVGSLMPRASVLLTPLLARMCHAYQRLNDIGVLTQILWKVPGVNALPQTSQRASIRILRRRKCV